MRLADLIVLMGRTVRNGGDFRRMGEAISAAQRFDIAPAAATVAGTIAASPVARIAAALPLARAPFQRTWVEWTGATGTYMTGSPIAEGENTPIRSGMLVETDATLQRGMMSFAYSAA